MDQCSGRTGWPQRDTALGRINGGLPLAVPLGGDWGLGTRRRKEKRGRGAGGLCEPALCEHNEGFLFVGGGGGGGGVELHSLPGASSTGWAVSPGLLTSCSLILGMSKHVYMTRVGAFTTYFNSTLEMNPDPRGGICASSVVSFNVRRNQRFKKK